MPVAHHRIGLGGLVSSPTLAHLLKQANSDATSQAIGLGFLRLGLGMIFVVFGVQKLVATPDWLVFFPPELAYQLSSVEILDPYKILRLFGMFEALCGVGLLLGWCFRLFAMLATFALIGIVYWVGLDSTGIRDVGLLSMAMALWRMGPGDFSLDAWLATRQRGDETVPARGKRAWATAACLAVILGAAAIPGTPADADDIRNLADSWDHEAGVVAGPIIPIPKSVVVDPEKVELGRRLFEEPRLSRDGTTSCASCHDVSSGGADGRVFSIGVGGATGIINSPTVLNAGFNAWQFWDGRARNLRDQIDGPITNPKEMGTSWPAVIEVLKNDAEYREHFGQIYPNGIRVENVKDAIAEYERSLITPNSKFDHFLRGNHDALTQDEMRGWLLFKDIGCLVCHQGINLGGNMFQRMGIMEDYFAFRGNVTDADLGRYNVTKNERDRYMFRVPTLRNIELTAPYFHDGSAATLEQSVQLMARFELGYELSAAEVDLLVKFLKTLTGEIPGR